MKIAEIIEALEKVAPPFYQENYDNAGLLTGGAGQSCTGILCTLDVTEAVVFEARRRDCNLIVAHHPIIFGGLKKLTGKNYVESTIITAIKNDIAIYAIHTNLDNVINGVNDKIADKLDLINRKILAPKTGQLMKLFTFAPIEFAEKVRSAIFQAGAGHVGNYSECSFNTEGMGTFKAEEGTKPYVGEIGKQHQEKEIRMEFVFPVYLQGQILSAMIKAHPYEEVAFDIVQLANQDAHIGSGIVGELATPVPEEQFLYQVKQRFGLSVIKHTKLLGKPVKKVALCGGAGSFLIGKAIAANADVYVTSDVKYHEFFDANDRIVVADIGHWESEQFTIDLLFDIITSKFPTFAVLKSEVRTNPVFYFA
jgi:dinuclear metal center YbgI/SA1388 family protein